MGLDVLTIAAYASIATSLAGAGYSAYASHQQGKAEEKMANYNAKLAQQEARNAELTAQENAKRQRKENRHRLAAIRSKVAKSGVAMGTGSPLDVLAQTAGNLELEALDLFREGELRRRSLLNQASMSVYQGQQAKSAANTQAIGSLIGGVSSAAGGVMSGYQSGVFRTSP